MKVKFRHLVIRYVVILGSVLMLFNSNVVAQRFFSTKGKELIGPDGRPFIMKGTNIGNWLVPEGYMFKFTNINSPRLIDQAFNELVGPDATSTFWEKYLDVYITKEDIHYLKSIGVNSIRIPFNYRLFTMENYLGKNDDTRGFKYLDRVIGWCREEKIFVVLDMHCAPGGQTGDNIDDSYAYPFLFENEKSIALCASIWKKIAHHYREEKIIIGYELLNEPIAHFFDKEKLNPLLENVYKRITKQIRAVDRNHIIILGGAQWNTNFSVFGPPFDDKLIYSFHTYWTPVVQNVIQAFVDFRDKYNVPIYCGETGENDDKWIGEFRNLLNENKISWHFWPYKKMDNARGIMTFSMPLHYDSIIVFTEKPKINMADVRQARPKDSKMLNVALKGFLENCQFKNCIQNHGYIKALGFEPGK